MKPRSCQLCIGALCLAMTAGVAHASFVFSGNAGFNNSPTLFGPGSLVTNTPLSFNNTATGYDLSGGSFSITATSGWASPADDIFFFWTTTRPFTAPSEALSIRAHGDTTVNLTGGDAIANISAQYVGPVGTVVGGFAGEFGLVANQVGDNPLGWDNTGMGSVIGPNPFDLNMFFDITFSNFSNGDVFTITSLYALDLGVPEPGTAAILAVAAPWLLRRPGRRRRAVA